QPNVARGDWLADPEQRTAGRVMGDTDAVAQQPRERLRRNLRRTEDGHVGDILEQHSGLVPVAALDPQRVAVLADLGSGGRHVNDVAIVVGDWQSTLGRLLLGEGEVLVRQANFVQRAPRTLWAVTQRRGRGGQCCDFSSSANDCVEEALEVGGPHDRDRAPRASIIDPAFPSIQPIFAQHCHVEADLCGIGRPCALWKTRATPLLRPRLWSLPCLASTTVTWSSSASTKSMFPRTPHASDTSSTDRGTAGQGGSSGPEDFRRRRPRLAACSCSARPVMVSAEPTITPCTCSR